MNSISSVSITFSQDSASDSMTTDSTPAFSAYVPNQDVSTDNTQNHTQETVSAQLSPQLLDTSISSQQIDSNNTNMHSISINDTSTLKPALRLDILSRIHTLSIQNPTWIGRGGYRVLKTALLSGQHDDVLSPLCLALSNECSNGSNQTENSLNSQGISSNFAYATKSVLQSILAGDAAGIGTRLLRVRASPATNGSSNYVTGDIPEFDTTSNVVGGIKGHSQDVPPNIRPSCVTTTLVSSRSNNRQLHDLYSDQHRQPDQHYPQVYPPIYPPVHPHISHTSCLYASPPYGMYDTRYHDHGSVHVTTTSNPIRKHLTDNTNSNDVTDNSPNASVSVGTISQSQLSEQVLTTNISSLGIPDTTSINTRNLSPNLQNGSYGPNIVQYRSNSAIHEDLSSALHLSRPRPPSIVRVLDSIDSEAADGLGTIASDTFQSITPIGFQSPGVTFPPYNGTHSHISIPSHHMIQSPRRRHDQQKGHEQEQMLNHEQEQTHDQNQDPRHEQLHEQEQAPTHEPELSHRDQECEPMQEHDHTNIQEHEAIQEVSGIREESSTTNASISSSTVMTGTYSLSMTQPYTMTTTSGCHDTHLVSISTCIDTVSTLSPTIANQPFISSTPMLRNQDMTNIVDTNTPPPLISMDPPTIPSTGQYESDTGTIHVSNTTAVVSDTRATTVVSDTRAATVESDTTTVVSDTSTVESDTTAVISDTSAVTSVPVLDSCTSTLQTTTVTSISDDLAYTNSMLPEASSAISTSNIVPTTSFSNLTTDESLSPSETDATNSVQLSVPDSNLFIHINPHMALDDNRSNASHTGIHTAPPDCLGTVSQASGTSNSYVSPQVPQVLVRDGIPVRTLPTIDDDVEYHSSISSTRGSQLVGNTNNRHSVSNSLSPSDRANIQLLHTDNLCPSEDRYTQSKTTNSVISAPAVHDTRFLPRSHREQRIHIRPLQMRNGTNENHVAYRMNHRNTLYQHNSSRTYSPLSNRYRYPSTCMTTRELYTNIPHMNDENHTYTTTFDGQINRNQSHMNSRYNETGDITCRRNTSMIHPISNEQSQRNYGTTGRDTREEQQQQRNNGMSGGGIREEQQQQRNYRSNISGQLNVRHIRDMNISDYNNNIYIDRTRDETSILTRSYPNSNTIANTSFSSIASGLPYLQSGAAILSTNSQRNVPSSGSCPFRSTDTTTADDFYSVHLRDTVSDYETLSDVIPSQDVVTQTDTFPTDLRDANLSSAIASVVTQNPSPENITNRSTVYRPMLHHTQKTYDPVQMSGIGSSYMIPNRTYEEPSQSYHNTSLSYTTVPHITISTAMDSVHYTGQTIQNRNALLTHPEMQQSIRHGIYNPYPNPILSNSHDIHTRTGRLPIQTLSNKNNQPWNPQEFDPYQRIPKNSIHLQNGIPSSLVCSSDVTILYYAKEMETVAKRIQEASHGAVVLHSVDWDAFPDEMPNLFLRNIKDVRYNNCVFLASLHHPSVVFEQLSVMYSIPRYCAKSFTTIIPWFCTGTMERIDTVGQVATAKTLARMLSSIPASASGSSQLVFLDVHALQELFYFSDQVMVRPKSCVHLLIERILQLHNVHDIAIAFPDDGAYKRFHKHFEAIFPTIICSKRREGDKRKVFIQEGNCNGKHCVIVDDLVQTGSTLLECAKALRVAGAVQISCYVTHGVFPKDSWKRFIPADKDSPVIDTFWLTDSIPTTAQKLRNQPPFEILSISDIILAIIAQRTG